MLKLLLLVVVLSLAIYAMVRLAQAGGSTGLRRQPGRPSQPPARPQGPDDDDDFLRDLDRRRRHPDDDPDASR